MKFRNLTDDTLVVHPADGPGYVVAAGETTPDLDRKQAAGLQLQTDKWAAVGEKPTKPRAAAKAEDTPAAAEES